MSLSTNAKWIGLEEIKKAFIEMPVFSMRAINSALSTVGYNLKKEAKTAATNNVFGWPVLSNMTRMTKAYPPRLGGDRTITGPGPSVARKIWGSIAPLIVYSVNKNAGTMEFGFMAGIYGKRYNAKSKKMVANDIGYSVVALAQLCTEGYSRPITSHKTQRYLAALGFPMKMGKVLTIPARPLIGPVFVMSKPAIPIWFVKKFWERITIYQNQIIGVAA